MQSRATLKVVAVLLMLVVSNATVLAQKRIRFQRGKSSATVRGPIGANGYLEYTVNGRAGQVMSIEITSGNGAVVVNAGTATGKSFTIDMSGGDHLLSVVNTGKRATNYTLTVSIR